MQRSTGRNETFMLKAKRILRITLQRITPFGYVYSCALLGLTIYGYCGNRAYFYGFGCALLTLVAIHFGRSVYIVLHARHG